MIDVFLSKSFRGYVMSTSGISGTIVQVLCFGALRGRDGSNDGIPLGLEGAIGSFCYDFP